MKRDCRIARLLWFDRLVLMTVRFGSKCLGTAAFNHRSREKSFCSSLAKQLWSYVSASQPLSSGFIGRRFVASSPPGDTTEFHRARWTVCCSGPEQEQRPRE